MIGGEYPNPEKHPLGTEAYRNLDRMKMDAALAQVNLAESHIRPPVLAEGRCDRLALWALLFLDVDCRRAILGEEHFFLRPPNVDPQTRYEVQAGILAVHHTLPFSLEERRALRGPVTDIGDNSWRGVEDMATREPELLGRWYDWLWQDEYGNVDRDVDNYGPSAVLEEACGRLEANLGKVLAFPEQGPS